jgi:hypothetical protein
MPFGKKKEAQPSQNNSSFSWELCAPSGGPHENYFVSSRGLLRVCEFYPRNPVSSTFVLAGYPAELPKTASTIYICSSALPHFVATMLPRIQHPFVLVSGDCDEDIPYDIFPGDREARILQEKAPVDREARIVREKQERRRAGAHDHEHADLRRLLEHEKLLHWFCQNWCGGPCKKVTAMPIGLDYHSLSDGTKAGQWSSCAEQERDIIAVRESAKPFWERWERSPKCYGNFHFFTFPPVTDHYDCYISQGRLCAAERQDACRLLDPAVMEYESERVPRVECWRRQSHFAFVVSPHGAGLDCHRTWEALVLGCIPIVKSSKIDVLYQELPVLIVETWDQVTQDLLQKCIQDMQSKTFNYEKLSLSYWSKLIKSHLSD